jgi:hypothetical protein
VDVADVVLVTVAVVAVAVEDDMVVSVVDGPVPPPHAQQACSALWFELPTAAAKFVPQSCCAAKNWQSNAVPPMVATQAGP